jgi:hypothetical protein
VRRRDAESAALVRDGVGGGTHWGFVDPFFADRVDRTLP